MNLIKEIREQLGYTQDKLAKESNLALRTIQRLESSNKAPKGYTLNRISKVFNMEASCLLEKFQNIEKDKRIENNSIRYINLSILSFVGIPFGNIIFPFILWKKYRKSKLVDETGRRIINFQIIWWLILSMLLCISPYISRELFNNTQIILYVLSIAYAINVVIVCATAMKLKRNNFNFLNIPLRFI